MSKSIGIRFVALTTKEAHAERFDFISAKLDRVAARLNRAGWEGMAVLTEDELLNHRDVPSGDTETLLELAYWVNRLSPGIQSAEYLAENHGGDVSGDHLAMLDYLLGRETERLNNSRTESERALRQVWVDQMKRERDSEITILMGEVSEDIASMSTDEILAELVA